MWKYSGSVYKTKQKNILLVIKHSYIKKCSLHPTSKVHSCLFTMSFKDKGVIHLVHLHFSFVFVYIYDQATLVLNCTHCEVVYNFLKLLQKSTKATCSNSSKIFRKLICLGTWQVHFFFSFFFFWLHLKVQFLRSTYPSSDWIEENRTYMKWRWGKWVKTVKMLLTCKSLDLNQLLNV